MLVLNTILHTTCRYEIFLKTNRHYLNKYIKINKTANKEIEIIIVLLFSLDFGGFLISIKTIIVVQKIANMPQPVRKA